MELESTRKNCVVFGAGALGLGFLGPELSDAFALAYVDIPDKGDLLGYLAEQGRFTVNETGPSARALEVGGVRGIRTDDTDALRDALDVVDLVFTAVGEPNLPHVAPHLAWAAARRRPHSPLRVLCCENGIEIAEKLTGLVEKELEEPLEGRAVVGDTVMGRMCRIAWVGEEDLEPVAPPCQWAVAAEPFFGMPVERKVTEGLETQCRALQPTGPEVFAALEDVKMFAHNGLHAFLAFLGALKGRRLFCELRDEPVIMEMARGLLVDEIWPALRRKHGPALDRNYYLNFAPSITRRITCPGLADAIARGTRGAMRKFRPWERMVYGVRTVSRQGVRPENYATGLAAGIEVARRQAETDMSPREVLTDHCGFDPREEADLIELVEEKGRALDTLL